MLETFNLKRALEQTRQELSNALYQEDAARRVIARLIKERDDARKFFRSTLNSIFTYHFCELFFLIFLGEITLKIKMKLRWTF